MLHKSISSTELYSKYMNRNIKISSFILLLICNVLYAQEFTRQDTLKGSITPERAWWDLQYYHLTVKVNPDKKSIEGTNLVRYKPVGNQDRMQIDLQPPMQLLKATQGDVALKIDHDGSAHFLHLPEPQDLEKEYEIMLYFSGTPKEALNPPWDGGITWTEDDNGKPFIASSNQGIGASVWWPNKDHGYDEPDQGVLISVEVPKNLMDVSNGRLIKTDDNKKTKIYHWEVKNPINNYGVNINIGDYVHFSEKYAGEKGELDMDYFVLRDNLEKAKAHFSDAKRTIEAFEHWFGPYPFYEDSYKLVDAPYLGMEHQSSVTYGNGYQKGYRGRDLSASGWGMTFDFIIVHESGHEWFANSITCKDVADLWVHEGFANYSENLFLEYHYGKKACNEYVRGTRLNIQNDSPIIGTYNVSNEGSSDMYYKGGNLLHMIRQIINDDEKWREILRGLNKDFYHQVVTSADVEKYMSTKAGKDLSKVFDQYLHDVRIPLFEYGIIERELWYRWNNAVTGFNMPLQITIDGEEMWVYPTTGQWNKISITNKKAKIIVDPDFYVGNLNIVGE